MNLCLFDLDHTLLPIDSDHAWGCFAVRLGWADEASYLAANEAFYQQYLAGELDLNAFIRFSTRALQGRSPSELARAQAQFMTEVVGPQIRPEALALIDQHRQRGDQLAIVTATNAFVTRPIATALGVETLLAVELEQDAQGHYTGEIQGIPTFREGKVTRAEAWLAQQGLQRSDFDQIHVYSDSINDLPLLEWATHPVATNPAPSLAALAQARAWPQLALFA